MKRPLRKDISGAAGGGLGAAVGILVIGALRQWAGVDPGPVESGAIVTVAGAVVSLAASWLMPLSETEERAIARKHSPFKEPGVNAPAKER